jgi:hypothetical protein
MNTQWLFFDLGSTLIDETKAYEHRIYDAIEGTDITFEQFMNNSTKSESSSLCRTCAAILKQ